MTLRLDGSDPRAVSRAARILREGGLVAFPTETVYGLGADGLSTEAVTRIFRAKGRPADNPLILHVPSFESARVLWDAPAEALERAARLTRAFWPGPLTLVLGASGVVPSVVTGGMPTVAARAPAHPVARALLDALERPLAAPSANRSGRPSPTTAEHVLATLEGRIDAVLDGGATRVGLESTVLSLHGDRPRILRPGPVGPADLLPFLPELDAAGPTEEERAHSPGLRHRHYAPRGVRLRLVDGRGIESVWLRPVALLCRAGTARACREALGEREGWLETLPDDPGGFARELYGALYRLEASGVPEARVERPPSDPAWNAVRDRVERAAEG